MRNPILLLTALAAAGLVSVAVPAAAQAATAPATAQPASVAIPANTLCPQPWFCVWHGPPRVGGWLGGMGRHTCYTPFTDTDNAVSNQTGRTIRVFSATGCHGSYFDLPTGHYSYPTPFIIRSVETF